MLTERLDLRPVSAGDLDALFAINSDPRTWAHGPGGRHPTRERTAAWIERAAARWTTDGISYWTVRLRSDRTTIGVGGVQRHAGGGWNLYYRFALSAWGNGYATELGRAALSAAAEADPDVPVHAWIDAHNEASRRVAERLGLTDYGVQLDANDGVHRHAYSDRPPDLTGSGLPGSDLPGG